jgi:hypothetical protein
MKSSALLIIMCFGVQAWAQTVGSKADSVQPAIELASLNSPAMPNLLLAAAAYPTPSFMPEPLAPAPVITIMPAPGKPKVADRTVDKKFLLLFGVATALTVTDIELTQHCLHARTCSEANTFYYGANPTRARMYGVNVPILSAQMISSAWFKRRHPERKQWMISPLADSVSHGFGSITGALK